MTEKLAITFAIPGELSGISGGYEYCRRLFAGFDAAGVRAEPLQLPMLHPEPTADALRQTEAMLSEVEGPLLIDCLAYGAFPASLADQVGPRTIALHHHPLCLETGLNAAQADALEASEGYALRAARGVIVTSPTTARTVREMFAVPEQQIAIARPGTVEAPRSLADGTEARLLAVGAVIPRKGFDLLIDALALMPDAPWTLDIVGPLTVDLPCVADLRGQIAALQLDERVALHGAVAANELAAWYSLSDIFVSSALYEGYGMALAEAVNRGLPIVAAEGGAVSETAPSAQIADIRDAAAFAAALRPLITDLDLRKRAADASWDAAHALPRWEQTVAEVADALRRFL
ncbi:MAG: glycosyltransferase family 4 protein [Pseudomonadota bacterium]